MIGRDYVGFAGLVLLRNVLQRLTPLDYDDDAASGLNWRRRRYFLGRGWT